MIIAPTADTEIIKSIIYHPEIFEHIAEDNVKRPDKLPPDLYLAGYVDGTAIGIFWCTPVSRYVLDVHVHVLPEYRKKHAFTFGKAVIDWIWTHTECQKMVAQVPFCCENVKQFAETCGFKVEGVNRHSWHKHGAFHDSYYLGIVRGE